MNDATIATPRAEIAVFMLPSWHLSQHRDSLPYAGHDLRSESDMDILAEFERQARAKVR